VLRNGFISLNSFTCRSFADQIQYSKLIFLVKRPLLIEKGTVSEHSSPVTYFLQFDLLWFLGVRPFQRTLERMTWCMQQDFCHLNSLGSADVRCLTCSLKLTGYFGQRYVKHTLGI